jgi:hypothetical protein
MKITQHQEDPEGEADRCLFGDFLRIDFEDGTKPEVFISAREPEDVLFCRDLDWIPRMLRKAFEAGKRSNK